MPTIPPSRLYKYQRVDSYNLANLFKNEFFFRAPSQFNDPYDCALDLQMDIEKFSNDKLLQEALTQDPELSEALKIRINETDMESILEGYRHALLESMETMFDDLKGKVRSRLKVTCLSAKNDNMLMWSHYADAGKGFCLEFDSHHPSFEQKVHQVKYVRAFPKLDPLTMNYSRSAAIEEIFQSLAYIKSLDWSYEEEWRIILMDESPTVAYEPCTLKGIYFGTRVEDEQMFSVIKAAQESGANPAFYLGHTSKDEFKIEFSALNSIL
jgi:hypothetical protein